MNTRTEHNRSKDNSLLDAIHRLKWKKPSFLGGVTTCVYLTSLLLYVIAISTNHWVQISTDESRVNAGLWSACVIGADDVETCSTELFYIHLVKKGNHWHTVSRWTTAIGLIVWFGQEFVIIAIIFMRQTSGKAETLTGASLILPAVTGACLFLTLVMVSTEVKELSNGALSWSFSVAILALLLIVLTEILTAVTLHIGKIKGRASCLTSVT